MSAMSKLKRISQIGEFGLIKEIAKITKTGENVIKGIGDDAAVLPYSKDKYLLLTADMLVEDVHFKISTDARLIGRKALACNISDIAALGGIPQWAAVSLGIPKNLPVELVKNIYKGMQKLAQEFSVSIVGGDTAAAPKIIINIALVGEIRKNVLVLRSGARKGDMIFVTGPLGGSLKSGKHLRFTPRLKESQYLIKNFKPTAMIDISDGLAGDLGHILVESKTGAFIYEEFIPKAKGAAFKDALGQGEDFELCFTLPPARANQFLKTKNKEFHFIYIGKIVDKKEGFVLVKKNGQTKILERKGFTHF